MHEQFSRTDAPSPAVDDRLAKLEKLESLRERGILTEADFKVQKARVLSLPSSLTDAEENS